MEIGRISMKQEDLARLTELHWRGNYYFQEGVPPLTDDELQEYENLIVERNVELKKTVKEYGEIVDLHYLEIVTLPAIKNARGL